MSTPAKLDLQAPYTHQLVALLVLFWGYFSANLLLRWLRNCLYHARMTEGWPDTSTAAVIYQLLIACLPVALWAWIFYGLARRFPRVFNRVILALVMLLVLVGVELDMNWFSYSHIHLSVDDILVYLTLTANPNDVGLDPWTIVNFAKNLAAHVSPAFRVEEGDQVTVGQCRPLSKTVRF